MSVASIFSCAASSSASETSACAAATSVLAGCIAGDLAIRGVAGRAGALGLTGLVAALITGFGGGASSVAAITVVFSGIEGLGKTIAPLNQLMAIKCKMTAEINTDKRRKRVREGLFCAELGVGAIVMSAV